jgi:hypothetical protein
MLDAKVQSSFALATWRTGFVHTCHIWLGICFTICAAWSCMRVAGHGLTDSAHWKRVMSVGNLSCVAMVKERNPRVFKPG